MATEDSESPEQLVTLPALEQVPPSRLGAALLGLDGLSVEDDGDFAVGIVVGVRLVDAGESVGRFVDAVLGEEPAKRGAFSAQY